MIDGIGIDLVEIQRIRQMIKRFGQSFLDRVYTEAEQREAGYRQDPAAYYSGRWAAKEALGKALGCGIGSRCSFTDIETTNSPTGKPVMTLSGEAAKTMSRMGGKRIFVSVSHEASYAICNVIIEH
jgi:holo-[acyl-carrier protein] synthase